MEVGQAAGRLGRYTLLRSLGAGGMAELFLARADGIQGFSKLVALKRVLAHQASNERFVRMLLNEARLVASLDHPNIATVYDMGVDHGEYFFAMEYVHGQDLRHVIKKSPNKQLPLENALHVAIGMCAGLHHAHEARDPHGRSLGIVHRDVSPSNVLISYEGTVKLADFGVAKAATLVSETRDGSITGKFGYMSPEQILGNPLDRRSDVFAVGIVLWEMTVGRRLYPRNGELRSMQRVVYVDAPRPSRFIPAYPPVLDSIVMRALARDPALRYQTAQELQLELESFALAERLPISTVTMAHTMRALFRERLDGWHEAERHGRSLAEHLASELISEEVTGSEPEDSEVATAVGIDAAPPDLNALDANPFAGEPTTTAAGPTHVEGVHNPWAGSSGRAAQAWAHGTPPPTMTPAPSHRAPSPSPSFSSAPPAAAAAPAAWPRSGTGAPAAAAPATWPRAGTGEPAHARPEGGAPEWDTVPALTELLDGSASATIPLPQARASSSVAVVLQDAQSAVPEAMDEVTEPSIPMMMAAELARQLPRRASEPVPDPTASLRGHSKLPLLLILLVLGALAIGWLVLFRG